MTLRALACFSRAHYPVYAVRRGTFCRTKSLRVPSHLDGAGGGRSRIRKDLGAQDESDYGPEYGFCCAHQRWRSIRCDRSAAGSPGRVDQEWESKCRLQNQPSPVPPGVSQFARAHHKPDIGLVDAFKNALLSAKSITYLPVPGVPQIIEGLGIKDAIASKVTIPKADISSELVAKGEIELGIMPVTQVFTTPGVELEGPLPPDIQFYSAFGGAVSTSSTVPDAARELLTFLKGPTASSNIKAQGMEPI